MKKLEENIQELEKVAKYTAEKNKDSIEKNIEKYTWIEDNHETFATAIDLIKQLASGKKDIKEVIGALKELTFIKKLRLENMCMNEVEKGVTEAEIMVLEILIDKYDKY